jgi:hypothetical protein
VEVVADVVVNRREQLAPDRVDRARRADDAAGGALRGLEQAIGVPVATLARGAALSGGGRRQVDLVAGDPADGRIGERSDEPPDGIALVGAVGIGENEDLAAGLRDGRTQRGGLAHARQVQDTDERLA